jgi:hypothetical protein
MQDGGGRDGIHCMLSSAGHTYCASCVEQLLEMAVDISTCPECRYEFEFDDVRRLFIKPSARSNNPATQSTEDEGFIKQAKHIAERLGKINAESPSQSVKNAVDVIEHVATIQCKEAQARPPFLYFASCVSHPSSNVAIGNSLEGRARILAQTGPRL